MERELKYEVTVWDLTSGDVVAYRSNATEEELRELEGWYGDDGIHDVVIDSEWEEDADDS